MANLTTKANAIAPTKFEQELVKLDQGITTNFPATSTLVVNGTPMKAAAMDSTIQGYLKTFHAVDPARQAYTDAVNQRRAITVQARTFSKLVRAAIKTYFGPQSPLLASFGIPADKARKTTAASTVVAKAKGQATRKVRGTLGKKAKLQVNVVGQPPVSIASDGSLQVGAPPINHPAQSSTAPAAAGSSAPATTPAPAGSGSGSNTPGSGSTPAGA